MVAFSAIVLLASASGVLASPAIAFPRAACNADNCLRALTGTQPGQKQTASARIPDCSSFMKAYVTPETVTVTATESYAATQTISETSIITNTVDSNPLFVKRAAVTSTATAIPGYLASQCGFSPSRYSSACACAGVTATTITVAAPTLTVLTESITSTTTTIAPVETTITEYKCASSDSKFGKFFQHGGKTGDVHLACGKFENCITLPDQFKKQLSSHEFALGVDSCDFYEEALCTGARHTVWSGSDANSLLTNFNDRAVSYTCHAPGAGVSPLVTLYEQRDNVGSGYTISGNFGTCYNVPSSLRTSSMSTHLESASGCTLYSGINCSGSEINITADDNNPNLINDNGEFTPDSVRCSATPP